MRLYLAGPMTGIPQFNFPLFIEATEHLRTLGHDVVTPAELDSPEALSAALASPDGDLANYQAATGETFGTLLSRDVRMIADEGIEGVVVLPGWERSRGARLETFVAHLLGLPVLRYPGLWRIPKVLLAGAWVDGV